MSEQDFRTVVFTKHTTPKTFPKYVGSQLSNDEEFKPRPVANMEIRNRIQTGRLAKNITQKQLAERICKPPKDINEYESGKKIPDNTTLGKIERELGIKLRGKLE